MARKTIDNHADVVYCLYNARTTYVGVTNNFKRRLRQHNGEIAGGARYTHGMRRASGQESQLGFLVAGFGPCDTPRTRSDALMLEWRLHGHVTLPRKRANPFGTSSLARRAWQLQLALTMKRVTKRATPTARWPLHISWTCREHYVTATTQVAWPPLVTHHLVCMTRSE